MQGLTLGWVGRPGIFPSGKLRLSGMVWRANPNLGSLLGNGIKLVESPGLLS